MMSIYSLVKKIPKGKVTTYGLIARKLGIHSRTVASVLKKNFNKNIPCHRVVYTNGEVGGYNRGVRNKIRLLRKEGLKIKNGRIINFREVLFTP